MPWNRCRSFVDGKEFLIESIFADTCFLLKPYCIFMEILCFRIRTHHLANIVIISCRDEGTISNSCGIFTMNEFFPFRRNTPVTISVFFYQSIFLVLVFQVFQPSFYVGIIFFHRCIIAILLDEHIERERQCGWPCDIIAIVIPESGSDIGNTSVFALCLYDVSHPFAV